MCIGASPCRPDAVIDDKTFRLDGRLALVTGSSAGIGRALARGLAQAGAAVVLNGRDAARLEATAAALRAEGLTVHERAFDVCDATAVEAAIAGIEADIGPSDVLVNNAGIQTRAPFHEFGHADGQEPMRTNRDRARKHNGRRRRKKKIEIGETR